MPKTKSAGCVGQRPTYTPAKSEDFAERTAIAMGIALKTVKSWKKLEPGGHEKTTTKWWTTP
ncbi:MAG: hypothetical protein NXI00_07015 [Cytophagales bacterium]|nr:hypothetical protein [Cytophagales bacterium]